MHGRSHAAVAGVVPNLPISCTQHLCSCRIHSSRPKSAGMQCAARAPYLLVQTFAFAKRIDEHHRFTGQVEVKLFKIPGSLIILNFISFCVKLTAKMLKAVDNVIFYKTSCTGLLSNTHTYAFFRHNYLFLLQK